MSALIVALAIAKVTNKLIVATITKKDLCLWDPILVSLVVMFMNQYWYAIIPEVPLLYLGVFYSIFNLATYLYRKASKKLVFTIFEVNFFDL